MSAPIIYVDQSEIRDGKFEALKQGMNELASFVETNEPRLLAYNVYFDEERTRMTVVHIHPDSSSLETHMQVAGQMFPRFADLIRLIGIDIYGRPSAALVERLREKAEMLGSGAVRVHDFHVGVARFTSI